MHCEQAQEYWLTYLWTVPDVSSTHPIDPAVQAHIQQCPACQAYQRELEQLTTALAFTLPTETPASDLKARLMLRVQQTPQELDRAEILDCTETRLAEVQPQHQPPQHQPQQAKLRPQWAWWSGGLLAAAVTGLLWIQSNHQAVARWTPAPAVVISTGTDVVVANNKAGEYAVVVLAAGKRKHIAIPTPRQPYFTEGIYKNGIAYLLDTENHQLYQIDVAQAKLLRQYAVHDGASGLWVDQSGVWVKCALSGFLSHIKPDGSQSEIVLGQAKMIPPQEFQDAVLAQGSSLWVTHHSGGMLFRVNAQQLKVEQSYALGGRPLALATWQSGLLVLDEAGRLLWLDAQGQLKKSLSLPMHPNKMLLSEGKAYLSDPEKGLLTVDVKNWKISKTQAMRQIRDVAMMNDGRLAVVQKSSVTMLKP